MDPRQLYIDKRLIGSCVYCGGDPDSRDHVPSRILLDDPFPSDLPVVEACSACNSGFSLDEEYFACFLECVIVGSTNPASLSRHKIKRILERKHELTKRIQSCCHKGENETLIWSPENNRVRNVVLKLARGHAAFELSLPQLNEPNTINFMPFISMSDSGREAFENPDLGEFISWPEIGSRSFIRSQNLKPYANKFGQWTVVQPGRYRYLVNQQDDVRVQVAIAEYLACIIKWN